MKLWLLRQMLNQGYDTYSDCVVAADSADEARRIHPSGLRYEWHGQWCLVEADGRRREEARYSEWAPPEGVTVKYIGEADESIAKGVLCASYHAG